METAGLSVSIRTRRVHLGLSQSAAAKLAAGVELAEVAQRLGHGSVATTASVYAHALPAKASAAADLAAEHTARLLGA